MLLADENVPKILVDALRDKGVDVLWIVETAYRGMDDKNIAKLASKEGRVILTRDHDFLTRKSIGVIHIGTVILPTNCNAIANRILETMGLAKGHIMSIGKEGIVWYW